MKIIQRLKSLWLVLTMPGSGIPETLDMLGDCRDFYRERAAYVPAIKEPTIESFPIHLAEQVTAPGFEIDWSEYDD